MARIALVTGATGYIASKLCQRLLDEGWIVNVLARKNGRSLPLILAERCLLHDYDGSTDSVINAIRTSKPTIVLHLASLFIAEHKEEQVKDLILSNVLYGTQLLEACVREGVQYLINTGTAWQNYRSTDYDPVCLYAATKQAFENILDFYTDAFSLKAITLKLFDTYGPDDPRSKILNLLIKTSRDDSFLGMTPGDQLLDLVHIDDVINAYIVCAEKLISQKIDKQHMRFSVSSGNLITVKELVKLFEGIKGDRLNVLLGTRSYRDREVMTPIKSDSSPPDWRPQIDLYSGISSILLDKN